MKLSHIDSLRAVAILLVIITHVSQMQVGYPGIVQLVLDFGKIGVQLFFFLSAYTLCLSMSVRKQNDRLYPFYIRRFFRIAPLYYVGIIVYGIVSYLPILNQNGYLSLHENYTFKNVLSNIFFLHGFIPSANNTIVPGGWSIGTEMAFYIIFPFIYAVYDRIIGNVKLKLILLPILGLLLANSVFVFFYYFLGIHSINSTFFYYNVFNQLSVFLIGISYFYLEKRVAFNLKIVTLLVCFLSLFIISFVLMYKLKNNISISIFIAALSFCFLFEIFKKSRYQPKILTRIGQLSFSIYIFHFLFVYIVLKLLSPILINYNTYLVFFVSFIATVIFSSLIALFSEKFIEKPGIELGRHIIRSLKK